MRTAAANSAGKGTYLLSPLPPPLLGPTRRGSVCDARDSVLSEWFVPDVQSHRFIRPIAFADTAGHSRPTGFVGPRTFSGFTKAAQVDPQPTRDGCKLAHRLPRTSATTAMGLWIRSRLLHDGGARRRIEGTSGTAESMLSWRMDRSDSELGQTTNEYVSRLSGAGEPRLLTWRRRDNI